MIPAKLSCSPSNASNIVAVLVASAVKKRLSTIGEMKKREEEIRAVHRGLLRSLDLDVPQVRIMNWAAIYHSKSLTNMVVANPVESGTRPGCSESR